MLQSFAPILGFEPIDELLDLVAMRAVEHQHGVLRRNNDDIIDADNRREMIVGTDMHVLGVHHDAMATHRIAVAVMRR